MLNSLLSNFSSKIIIKKTNGRLSWSKAINGYVINLKKLVEKHIAFISPTQSQITILNDNFQKIGVSHLFPDNINKLENSECIKNNVSLNVVLLGNEVIALCDDNEENFLLLFNMLEAPITKDNFGVYVNNLLCEKAKRILNTFSHNITLMDKFLVDNSFFIGDLSINEYERLKYLINLINDFFKGLKQ